MWTTVAVVIALLVATCKFLDEVYLTETQKQDLNLRVLAAWNWLDEARRRSLLDSLRTRRSRLLVSAIAIAIVVGFVWAIDGLYDLLIPLLALPAVYMFLSVTPARRRPRRLRRRYSQAPPPPRICHNEQPSTLRPGVG